MKRRTVIGSVGAGAVASLGGCLTRDDEDEERPGNDTADGDPEPDDPDLEGTLRVATYESMVDGENPAGPWLKEQFEAEFPDAELEWTVPESGINHYIQRERQEADLDADLYLGINVDDLARIDDSLSAGGLFRELNADRIDRSDRIRDGLDVGDPHGRVLAYDTGYISLVYDETVVDEPGTFDDLIDPEYADALLAQNAQTSDPGQAFLLWTIDAYGADGYLDYWRDLADNGVRILDDWSESYYGAYMQEERPMVVSYSTDQVFAADEGYDMSRHQVAFLDDQGYANPETMGIFERASKVDLAYEFLDFVLSNDAQAEIAQRNVQFPAVEDEFVDLDEAFDQYAHEPPEAVTLGYDRLRGNLDGWVDDWAREFASQ
ncbi:thiamine ABC transporter substrate-binding protein [Halosolutus halophilus]|uniref:thiamine ABC transporter substrate-binding protein n=1 Tax=Halosolutus halophilus TaxID=1552990 RepID=UPI002235160E|nr:thiamine ABC transporter substrate-binding protein [Halosolutus halophilus]